MINVDFWKNAASKWISVLTSKQKNEMDDFIDAIVPSGMDSPKYKAKTLLEELLEDDDED